MEVERSLGLEPVDRETDKLGYDIESRVPGTGKLRFIEVKGRVAGASTVTVTKNEILTSLNKPADLPVREDSAGDIAALCSRARQGSGAPVAVLSLPISAPAPATV